MSKVTRKEVYNAIDSERDYQESLGADRTDGSEHTVGDFALMMQHYQHKLVDAWVLNAGDDEALEIMRKIAGISVQCMEKYGAPHRRGKFGIWN